MWCKFGHVPRGFWGKRNPCSPPCGILNMFVCIYIYIYIYIYATFYIYCSFLEWYETAFRKPILQTLTPLENAGTTILQVVLNNRNVSKTICTRRRCSNLVSVLIKQGMAPTYDKILSCKTVSIVQRAFLHSRVTVHSNRSCNALKKKTRQIPPTTYGVTSGPP